MPQTYCRSLPFSGEQSATTNVCSIIMIHSITSPQTWKRFLSFFLPLALALCLVFFLFYRQQMSFEISMLQNEQLDYLLQQKQWIETIINEAISDTRILARSQPATAVADNPKDSNREALGRHLLLTANHKPNYSQIRFLDSKGMELVRVEQAGEDLHLVPPEKLQNKSDRYYVREALALEPGQLYVSRFDLNMERGKLETPFKPMLRFVAPVANAEGLNGGLLIVNYLGGGILKGLRSTELRRGHLEMLDQESFWLLAPQAEREWGFMMPERSQARMDLMQPELWNKIKKKAEGQFLASMGLITFVQVRLPENTLGPEGWHLVADVPTIELDKAAEVRPRLILLTILLVVGAFFCWLLARAQVRHRMAEARVRKDAENQRALKSLLNLRLEEHPLDRAMQKALDILLSVSWLRTLHMGGIMLTEHGDKPLLRLVAQRDLEPQIRSLCATVAWGHCLCGQAAASGELQHADHVDSRHHNQYEGMVDHGHYNIPLMKGNVCKGVLVLYLPKGKKHEEEEAAFLKSAGDVLAGILDRHEQEMAVRASEARLNAVVETAVEGIVTIDQKGEVISFNRAAEKIFGYRSDEILGRPVNLLQPDSVAAQHDHYIKRYLETGEAKVIGIGREVTGRRKDGSLFPLYLSVGEVRQEGRIIFTGILRDISELKEAQRQLELAKEETEETNRQLLKKQHILDQDLEAAAGIQRALLPMDLPRMAGLELAWHFKPSQQIGGDIFNVARLSADHICFYLLDVSGHGVPSALVTVSVHEMLHPSSGHVLRLTEDGAASVAAPSAVADLLNREYPLERFEKFFTLFYSVLNIRTGVLVYTNAGHPAPVVVRPDGQSHLLEQGGTLIGFGQTGGYEQAEYQLRPGDRLFLYTDGLIEHESPEGQEFGEERLQKILTQNPAQDLNQWINQVLNQVLAFGAQKAPEDDISILAVEFTGQQ